MKSLLVIDDDAFVCMLLEKLAQRSGAVPTVVRTGEDARRVLAGGKIFDVIFLDLIIPFISGWDILTMIRADPATRDTPVVIMSGFFLSEEEVNKLRGNVLSIIDKNSFDAVEVESLLRNIPHRLN